MRMSWIVPAYDPNKLIRDQTMSLATLADLKKAVRVARDGGPTIVPKLWPETPRWSTHPDADDVHRWLKEHEHCALCLDLETTYSGQIMCCGLWCVEHALTSQGICIPFFSKGMQKYWNPLDELKVKGSLFHALKTQRVVGQNIVGFDIPMMRKAWGLVIKAYGDTMVAHSLCMPELPHGLAFLSSVFTDLPPYKKEFGDSKAEKDDVDKWERIQDSDDLDLRIYNLLDVFATAVTWEALVEMMA